MDIKLITSILLLLIIIYFLVFTKNKLVNLIMLSVILLPFSTATFFEPPKGMRGFEITNVIWGLCFFTFVCNQILKKIKLQFDKYFSIQLILFCLIYLFAAANKLFAGVDASSLIIDNVLRPFQILLTGWMLMVLYKVDENKKI